MATVKAQEEQQKRQQEIIEELRRTQQSWGEYVEKTLPGKVLATVAEAQKGNPTPAEIEAKITELIHANQPRPPPPTNPLSKKEANELVNVALARHAEENRQAMQRAIEEATQRAREESAGPSQEEIQRMIQHA